MSAQRPALADVLAALATCDDAAWWRMMLLDSPTRLATEGVEWKMGPSIPWARLRGWAHPTPADALAALVEAELLPEHWADDGRAPRWWCERCGGRGLVDAWTTPDGVVERDFCGECAEEDTDATGGWRAIGHAPAPPSHAALVAVASLGADTLARAEAIVAETWPVRALVWRVMTREALREHHEKMTVSGRGLPVVVSLEETQMAGLRWPVSYPRYSATRVSKDAARAWPALRALAALGLHLVALDAARVVLAVEAL